MINTALEGSRLTRKGVCLLANQGWLEEKKHKKCGYELSYKQSVFDTLACKIFACYFLTLRFVTWLCSPFFWVLTNKLFLTLMSCAAYINPYYPVLSVGCKSINMEFNLIVPLNCFLSLTFLTLKYMVITQSSKRVFVLETHNLFDGIELLRPNLVYFIPQIPPGKWI